MGSGATMAENNELLEYVLQSQRLVSRLTENKLFSKVGMGEWALLNEFPDVGGTVTLKRLILTSGLSRQRVKVLLDGLERRGAIQTLPQEEDKRARRLVMTDAGHELRGSIEADLANFQNSVLDESRRRALARGTRVLRVVAKALDDSEVSEQPAGELSPSGA